MVLDKHENTLERILEKEQRKGNYDFLGKHIPYSDENGNHVGEMDLCKIQYHNNKKYITYYEIKTGFAGRKKARTQAKRFYKNHPDWEARFIYVSTIYGVEYWKRSQFNLPSGE